MKCLPWLTHFLLYIPPLLSTTHTLIPLRRHTNMHRPTLMNTLPLLAKCSCAPAHLRRGGGLQAVWGLTCPLVTHTDVCTHTPGQTEELCMRHALILQPDDERQAAGLLSECQGAGPDRSAPILDPPPLPPQSSSALD